MANGVQIVVNFNDEKEHEEINSFLTSSGFSCIPKKGSLPRASWVWVDIVNKTYRIGVQGVGFGFNAFDRRITYAEMVQLINLLDLAETPDRPYCQALKIAACNHKGQFDKVGKEYLYHPLTVSHYCKSRKAKIVGLLHDVVEDTSVTIDELSEIFDDEIIGAIELVTKKEGYIIDEYYEKIKNNPLAREVKLSDLTHNMDVSRFGDKELTEKDLARLEKYKGYYAYLSE